jgi:hypothetical protein
LIDDHGKLELVEYDKFLMRGLWLEIDRMPSSISEVWSILSDSLYDQRFFLSVFLIYLLLALIDPAVLGRTRRDMSVDLHVGEGIRRPHDRQYVPPTTGAGVSSFFPPRLARTVMYRELL